jgi:dolichol kinase
MNLQQEFYRKCLHLLLLIVPMTYSFLGKWQSVKIFAAVTLFVVTFDYLRRKSAAIKKIFSQIFGVVLREHELSGDKLCGASFVGLAACINFSLFKAEIAITGFLILVISDTLAALVGKSIPSKPFFEKSVAGSLAFFISALAILFACGANFHADWWFYCFGIFAVFCVTMFEARPSLLNIDDNFSIPIGFSVILTFFDLAWNYNY